ncbi:hypothetical protein Tco_1362221 [Tanacetum coccineum]
MALLNLENPSPADNEIASLMETSARHATAVPEITSGFTTTIHPPPSFFNPLLQHATPAPTPTTSEATTLFTSLPNFTSVFKFNERVTNLEKDLSEIKQVDQYAQALSSIPAIADRYMDNKLGEAINKAIQAYNFDCREEAQAEKREYIELVDSTKNVTESLEVAVLTRSSSQPQSSYEAAATLFEFELTKIIIDKMERNKSYDIADHKRELYDALVKSYQIDKDLFDSYGEVFSLKRSQEDRDKDRDPFAGSDRVTKRRKSSKDAVSSRDSRSKEKKSSSTSKDASQSNISLPASLPMQMSQVILFKTQACNKIKSSSRETKMNSPLTRSQVARAEEFNEFLATPIDFSAFIMHRLKIDNLTQEVLTGPTYDLIKGTCKSVVELEYHLEEVFKATNDQLDWHNPEGKPYPHDLTKPLPLILNEQGRQVIHLDHFINNDLEYLKGGSSSKKYTTSIIKTKAADYGQVKWIEDKVQNVRNSTDMLPTWKHQKLTNLNLEERYALNVALRMFTRRIVIQEHVEDLQLGVKSYQKKINLKKPNTYCSNLRRMTPYTAYPDIQGIIYEDEINRNLLMRTDELHKFSDGTLNHVHTSLNDITLGIEMEYLLKRKWSKQDMQRARVMINAINKQLRDRRLMRSLEKFVGGRPYREDLRLLERTI